MSKIAVIVSAVVLVIVGAVAACAQPAVDQYRSMVNERWEQLQEAMANLEQIVREKPPTEEGRSEAKAIASAMEWAWDHSWKQTEAPSPELKEFNSLLFRMSLAAVMITQAVRDRMDVDNPPYFRNCLAAFNSAQRELVKVSSAVGGLTTLKNEWFAQNTQPQPTLTPPVLTEGNLTHHPQTPPPPPAPAAPSQHEGIPGIDKPKTSTDCYTGLFNGRAVYFPPGYVRPPANIEGDPGLASWSNGLHIELEDVPDTEAVKQCLDCLAQVRKEWGAQHDSGRRINYPHYYFILNTAYREMKLLEAGGLEPTVATAVIDACGSAYYVMRTEECTGRYEPAEFDLALVRARALLVLLLAKPK